MCMYVLVASVAAPNSPGFEVLDQSCHHSVVSRFFRHLNACPSSNVVVQPVLNRQAS